MPARNLIPAVLAVLTAGLLALGTYLGAWRGGGGSTGYLAAVDSCGFLTIPTNDKDWRFTCLPGIFSAVSVSGDGKTLAWDTKSNIVVAQASGANQQLPPLPAGANAEPSLSPDGRMLAFLHSPRDDGRYDLWTSSTTLDNAEQLTSTRDLSTDAWSPGGDWIAFVRGWSEQTLEGDIYVIHPDGTGERKVARGDAPAWMPDGSRFAFTHDNSVWTVRPDGSGARELVGDAHNAAWSRDGRILAFMREDPCGKAVCTEHAYMLRLPGGHSRLVGPQWQETKRLLWVTKLSVSQPPPK